MASHLEEKIIDQIEYYFGDINLPRDAFMKRKMAEDDGWITIQVLLTFRKLASLSRVPAVIAVAVRKCKNPMIEVSEDGTKIRRNPGMLPPAMDRARKEELMNRTAYVEGFPRGGSTDDVIDFLNEFGTVNSCVPHRSRAGQPFNGCCFVTFKDRETCRKFIEKGSVNYKGKELARKWQENYEDLWPVYR